MTPPVLVDSHVHLDRYPDELVAGMLRRAQEAGVARLLTIGTDVASSRAALGLAARHPGVLAAVGIHPSRLAAARQVGSPEWMLAAVLAEQRPAAIGEVGLDATAPDEDGQRRFLDACLGGAAEHALPLVLHVVGPEQTHLETLALVGRYPGVRVVAHYFVGGTDLARQYLEAGCWISVGRPVTRDAGWEVRAAVPLIPLARLLLETDTYPLPGRATEPKDVADVCAAVAALRGMEYAKLAAATTTSFAAFIGG